LPTLALKITMTTTTTRNFSLAMALSGAVLTLSCGVMYAQSAPAPAPAAAPDHSFSVNAGVVSDYRYRGISQSRLKPAAQFGADYSHSSGFYAGAWGSTINWIKDNSSSGTPIKGGVELDFYGGYKGSFAKDFAYDVGFLRYQYAGNNLANTGAFKNPNTDELYGAITYGPVTAKYSHSLGNLFGNYNYTSNKKTSGSGYFDVTASFDVGSGVMVAPHIGYQRVAGLSIANYTDYSLTVSKDFSGLTLSAAAIGTNADKAFYFSPKNNKALGKATLVVGAKYTYGF
jgi:uncharacterized protein (TIGR02001 family)